MARLLGEEPWDEDSIDKLFKKLLAEQPRDQEYYISHFCMTIYVVAGKGSNQVAFPVRIFSLEQSPVIKQWIFHPGTMPLSHRSKLLDKKYRGIWHLRHMKPMQDIYFEDHHPDVVKGVLFFLHYKSISEDLPNGPSFWEHISNPCYFVEFYSFASYLEMEWACQCALRVLRLRKPGSESFWNILQMGQIAFLVDKNDFRDWLLSYFAEFKDEVANPPPNTDTTEVIQILFHITTSLNRKLVEEEEKSRKIRKVLDGVRDALENE